jgi:hypothetical protein
MQAARLRLLLLVVSAALLPASLRAVPPDPATAGSLPEYHAGDAGAPVVTEQNLLASERFWPYQVALTRPWPPAGGGGPLPSGLLGVLIRVEASGSARIDFGRDGRVEVPVGVTDLVARANQIRRGELAKVAPNFVLAVGPRLVDSASDELRPLDFRAAGEWRGFLAVFADPAAKEFAALAKSLAPLRERDGVLTILFPQGEHPDAEVREQLRALEWPVPFVYDHLAESYTRSLLAGETSPPALILQTNEGRVLLQRQWSAKVVPEVERALETGFAPVRPPASPAGRPRTTSGGRAGGNPRSRPPGGGRRSDRGVRRRSARRSPR